MKRLDSSTSLFQRQTSLLTRKVSTLANKLVNPFITIKKKIEPTTTTVDSQVDLRTNMKRQVSVVNNLEDAPIAPRRMVTISPLKRSREEEEDDDDDDNEQLIERRKVQILSVNQDIRRPTGLFSYQEEPKRNGKNIKPSNKSIDSFYYSSSCSNIG